MWRTVLIALSIGSSTAAIGQVSDRPEMAMPVGEKLGEITFPNSGNTAAQAPFVRGVKLLHNFEYASAVKSFQAAEQADPNFALAYWGEAMAHNYSLWADQQTDLARAALGRLAPTPEGRQAKALTPREKMYLGALETLYGPGTKFERDIAYADKMDALATAYPDDVEAQTFDALATLGRSHGTRDEAGYMKAAAMLERLFPSHKNHPGVVHYMIHAYDDPAHAQLGLKAALLYDKIAPESAHALHMTSHIFLALGMWPETVAANERAIARANDVGAARHMRMDCGHGPIWLVYAKLQEGQDPAEDIERCRRAALDPVSFGKDETVIGAPEADVSSLADMLVRRGIETGNWSKPPELPAGHYEFARFTFNYGKVLASRHDPASAFAALADMRRSRAAIAKALPKELPDDDQLLPWLDRAIAQAEAVSKLAAGHHAVGIAELRDAAVAEAALPPEFGPPAIQKLSWELLGQELLLSGDKQRAAAAFRKALLMGPGRRQAVTGLKASAD